MFGLEWEDSPNNDVSESLDLFNPKILSEAISWGSLTNIDGSNHGVFGIPYIMEACEKNQLESVKILIENNANPNITHIEGNSALHSLFSNFKEENINLICYLLENGGDFTQRNFAGAPALSLCPAEKLNLFENSIVNRFENDREYFYTSYDSFLNGIEYALFHNLKYLEILERFYDGFNLNEYINQKNLFHFFLQAIKQQNMNIINILIEKNEIDCINKEDQNGFTLLHHAVQVNNLNIVKKLCNIPQININSCKNESPLHIASLHGFYSILKFLIEQNANVAIKTIFDPPHLKEDSILNYAIRNNHFDCVKLILDSDIDLLTLPNHWGNIPLHLAIMGKNFSIFKFLLQKNSDLQVNYLNVNLESPLHYVYRYCDEKDQFIELLIQLGANENLKNQKGELPKQVKLKNTQQNQNLRNSGNKNYNNSNNRNSNSRNNNNNRRNNNKRNNRSKNRNNNNKRNDNNNNNSVVQPVIEPPVESIEKIIEKPKELEDEQNLCVICMENEKNCLLKPCKHIATCIECSELISDCPICRSSISKKTQVFIA